MKRKHFTIAISMAMLAPIGVGIAAVAQPVVSSFKANYKTSVKRNLVMGAWV